MTECADCGSRPSVQEQKKYIDLCRYNRMADGRAFTDYNSKCQKLTPLSSYDERMFLMKNATKIMEESAGRFICSACLAKDSGASTMLPERYKQVCDKKTCKFVEVDENGVGLGRK